MINMKKKHSCKKCGYKWESKLENPLSCPRCKRYDWNKLVEEKE